MAFPIEAGPGHLDSPETTMNSERYTQTLTADEKAIIREATSILERSYRTGPTISSPAEIGHLFKFRLGHLPHEVFAIAFLDTRHRVIASEELFRGTIDGATVHPREVAKRALELNAAALILAHNHPSGNPEPSQQDLSLTRRLTEGMALLDIRVLDHIVVGAGEPVSLSERGLHRP